VTSTRLRSLAGLAVVAAVALSGCDSVPALNGGVAARVDGDTITMDDVASKAASYCAAVETQLTGGQSAPNSVVSSEVAGALALRSAADQFAADEGVTPDASFKQEQDALEANLGKLTASQKETVREVVLAPAYVSAVELAVGKRLVSSSDAEAAKSAGQDAFAKWIDDHDVVIDPRFNITIDGGVRGRANTDVSFPVSKTAKTAASGEQDQTYAAGLPSSQRCGG
jgi:hypothetical protein